MRWITLLTLVAALALCGTASAQPEFVFTGAGNGHGVGLAQYGAQGFALAGWTHEQILLHYYTGTSLGPAPARRIRVLLASGARSLTIGSAAPFRVRDATGQVVQLPAGTVELGPELTIETAEGPRTLASPVRFVPGKSPLELRRAYRGAILVHLRGSRLAAVNQVGLEAYLKGVVASEMPSHWHLEALKAQAVAARSYALASRETGGIFDVYADTRSQVYGGIPAEHERTSAAVSATKGQVVLYEGEVAWTFFSASSGGRTAAIGDVWADSEPLPYLVSVEDPHDDLSPYHRWGPITFTAEELEAKLGPRLPEGLTELRVNASASGRVRSVTAVGASESIEIPGWDVRMLLGLRSTWFEIAQLGVLAASEPEVVYGRAVTLTAAVPGARNAVLEQRRQRQPWSALRAVRVKADGTLLASVRPKATTWYRLRLPSGRTQPVRVAVARHVSLEAGAAGRLAGRVRPGLRGAAVTIERRRGPAWAAVAQAVVGRRGRFEVKRKVPPGTYRARVAGGEGLVAGTSGKLRLSAA